MSEFEIGTVIKAPAFNYHGWAWARVYGFGVTYGNRKTVKVKALKGMPWSDGGYYGWSPTDSRAFFPEELMALNETTPLEGEDVSEQTELASAL